MNKLPKRDDEIYKEIESFGDYELTQCVAYEMAIRNDFNLSQVEIIVDYYNDNKENIDSIDENNEYHRLLTHIHSAELVPFTSSSCRTISDEFCNAEYFVDNLYYNEDNRIPKIIYTILNDITIGEDGNRKRGLSSDEMRVITDDILDRNYLEKRIFRDGYFIETSISESSEHAIILIDEENKESAYKELGTKNDWKKYLEDGGENLWTENKLWTNFKRPKLKNLVGSFFRKYPQCNIDLNLPLNEIIAYITHIKNDIESDNSLKAPIELIGEELEKADNLICDDKGKCFDVRTVLSKQEKLADLFYIYDCLKLNATQRKIQNEVFNYYADKGIETKTLDSKTIKRYKEIAIEYIDNMRYRQLITGVNFS